MKQIPLTQGQFAIVDDGDFEWVSKWKWRIGSDGYAVRMKWIKGKVKCIIMHRLINNTPDTMYTDHINGNRLDNRRCNLRTCTNNQNQQNAKKRDNTSSKYKGVTFSKYHRKWRAQLYINNKHKHLGFYKNETEAAIAYNVAAVEIFGEFARLNAVI